MHAVYVGCTGSDLSLLSQIICFRNGVKSVRILLPHQIVILLIHYGTTPLYIEDCLNGTMDIIVFFLYLTVVAASVHGRYISSAATFRVREGEDHPTGNSCNYTELRRSPNFCTAFLECSDGGVEYEMFCPLILMGFGDAPAAWTTTPGAKEESTTPRSPGEEQRLYFSYEQQTCTWPDQVPCHHETVK